MTTIGITGASGFLGASLTKRLRELGVRAIGLNSTNGDITDESTLRAFDHARVGHIFHLAAKTFVPASWVDPIEFARVNSLGTLNVLEYCRKRAVSLTYVSAYVYGACGGQPIAEDRPRNPSNPYALSKVWGEESCELYAQQHDVRISIVRPFNVYGPGQSRVFLIPQILHQIANSDAIIVNDLTPKRDYLYIDDLIDLLVATRPTQSGLRVYNAGTGISLSVAEIVALAQRVAGSTKPVICKALLRSGEVSDTKADITRAKEELGWAPCCKIDDGMRWTWQATLNAR